MIKRYLLIIIGIFFLATPAVGFAASNSLVVAGWMPYWKKASGTPEMLAHLNAFQEISPFAYEVEDDGTIGDSMKLAAPPWTDLIARAHERKIKIIPTILWIHGDAIHATLSSSSRRAAHVDDIVSMVARNDFDGIDIDYENKISKSKVYFSAFLKELSLKLHAKKKVLVCTIEARTPPSSLYKVPPKSIERVNDYVVINKYCDEVRLMTYDQTTADIKLNKSKGDKELYAPVSDTDWVKKVVAETTKTISKKKIMLGVATYGYEYRVTMSGNDTVYTRTRAISHPDAMALAQSLGINMGNAHNLAGERSFNYRKNGGSLYYISWSDSYAIAQKVKLARSLGLRGVVLFKIDGQNDPGLWSVLK